MFSRLSVNAGRKLLLNANISSQILAKCKINYLASGLTRIALKNDVTFNFRKHSKIIGIHLIRCKSTTVSGTNEAPPNNSQESVAAEIQTVNSPSESLSQNVADNINDASPERLYISEIPDIPITQVEDIVQAVNQFHPNGEATFQSLSLGGYSPVGLIQSCLEFVHISANLPWWATIMLGTAVVRLLIFPLVVMSQRNIAHQMKHMPEMQKLQAKMLEARQSGNEYEAAVAAQDLYKFMGEKKVNPLKGFMVIGAQAPIFISFFMALRGMSNVPVESLRTGGLWWFTDLTITDPYFLLPIITCATMYTTVEISAMSMASNTGITKYILRAIPIITFPFLLNFPAAILCYWVSNNFLSLFQVGILKIDAVRKYFKIEIIAKRAKKSLPLEVSNFKEGVRNSWTNIKISKQLADKARADTYQFNQAGKNPIRKTFSYDPTKVAPPTAAAILTKKR